MRPSSSIPFNGTLISSIFFTWMVKPSIQSDFPIYFHIIVRIYWMVNTVFPNSPNNFPRALSQNKYLTLNNIHKCTMQATIITDNMNRQYEWVYACKLRHLFARKDGYVHMNVWIVIALSMITYRNISPVCPTNVCLFTWVNTHMVSSIYKNVNC